jgi:hypothetical protein
MLSVSFYANKKIESKASHSITTVANVMICQNFAKDDQFDSLSNFSLLP